MRSTAEELRAFKESPIWLDILDDINICLDRYRNDLLSMPTAAQELNLSTANILSNMGMYDGLIKGLTYVSDGMLDSLIDEYDIQKRKQNRPDDSEEDMPEPNTLQEN